MIKHIIITALAMGLFIGCQPTADEPPTRTSSQTDLPVTVAIARQVKTPVVIQTTGLIQADSETNYAFKIGGVIDAVYVDEGDQITKGQVLAVLRMDEINAQYQQAELGRDKAIRDFERVQSLYRDSIATLEEYQNATTQLEVTKRTIDQVGFNRRYAKIYAQQAGYVTTKLGNPGEVITPGKPVLRTNDAAGPNGFLLECTVNDRQWAQVAVLDSAAVTLDAYPEQLFSGKVVRKSAQADPTSGAFRIEVALSGVTQTLATGMYGQVVITTKETISALSIPFQALVQANGSDGYVYTPADANRVRRLPVRIQQVLPTEILVSEGLVDSQRVVLGNSAFLSPKSTIKIVQ